MNGKRLWREICTVAYSKQHMRPPLPFIRSELNPNTSGPVCHRLGCRVGDPVHASAWETFARPTPHHAVQRDGGIVFNEWSNPKRNLTPVVCPTNLYWSTLFRHADLGSHDPLRIAKPHQMRTTLKPNISTETKYWRRPVPGPYVLPFLFVVCLKIDQDKSLSQETVAETFLQKKNHCVAAIFHADPCHDVLQLWHQSCYGNNNVARRVSFLHVYVAVM